MKKKTRQRNPMKDRPRQRKPKQKKGEVGGEKKRKEKQAKRKKKDERERVGRRGGGNGRQWPSMAAITPLRERGRGHVGEGEEEPAASGSG